MRRRPLRRAVWLGLALAAACGKVERDFGSLGTGGSAQSAGSPGVGGMESLGGLGPTAGSTGLGGGGGAGRGGAAGGLAGAGGTRSGGTGPGGSAGVGGQAGAAGSPPTPCNPTCPLRVDFSRGSGGDGLTWATALGSLQTAVDRQWEAGGGEVWVRAGTLSATAAGQVLLRLRAGVSIYGGFAGTERIRGERQLSGGVSTTVLDGAGLAYPILGAASNALLDGFVVRGGSGESGPALRVTGSLGLKLRDVRFQSNTATGCGGAVYLDSGELSLEGGAFVGNDAAAGGGLCARNTPTLTIVGTLFSDNTALRGAGIYAAPTYMVNPGPTVTLERCVFRGNTANYDGQAGDAGNGAGAYFAGTTLEVLSSDFVENNGYASDALYFDQTRATVVNSVFAHNVGLGPAIRASSASTTLTITNATFAFNDTTTCMGPCDIDGPDGPGYLYNSIVVLANKNNQGSVQGMTVAGGCSLYVAGGLGQQPSPFVDPLPDRDGNGVGDYLLEQPGANPCVDVGSDANATAASLDWANMTTSGSNCADRSPVDAGRHYPPSVVGVPPCT